MKFYLFILVLAVVQAARPDFGDDDAKWIIRSTQWKKFKQLKGGLRIFFDACQVRLGGPKNTRPDSNWKMEWIDDKSFKIFQKRTGKDKKGNPKKGYFKNFRTFKLVKRFGKEKGTIFAETRKKIKMRGRGEMTQKYQYTIQLIGGAPADLDAQIISDGTCSTPGQFSANSYRRNIKKQGDNKFDKCGTAVSKTCEGQEVEMSDEGWQKLTEEAVDGGTFLINAFVQTSSRDFSVGMMKGINAGRCAVTNLGTNFWNIIGSVYYLAMEFEYEEEVEKLINEYNPYLCTCQEEIDAIKSDLGAKKKTKVVMSGCSEMIQRTASKNQEAEDGGIPKDSVDAYDSGGSYDPEGSEESEASEESSSSTPAVDPSAAEQQAYDDADAAYDAALATFNDENARLQAMLGQQAAATNNWLVLKMTCDDDPSAFECGQVDAALDVVTGIQSSVGQQQSVTDDAENVKDAKEMERDVAQMELDQARASEGP